MRNMHWEQGEICVFLLSFLLFLCWEEKKNAGMDVKNMTKYLYLVIDSWARLDDEENALKI